MLPFFRRSKCVAGTPAGVPLIAVLPTRDGQYTHLLIVSVKSLNVLLKRSLVSFLMNYAAFRLRTEWSYPLRAVVLDKFQQFRF